MTDGYYWHQHQLFSTYFNFLPPIHWENAKWDITHKTADADKLDSVHQARFSNTRPKALETRLFMPHFLSRLRCISHLKQLCWGEEADDVRERSSLIFCWLRMTFPHDFFFTRVVQLSLWTSHVSFEVFPVMFLFLTAMSKPLPLRCVFFYLTFLSLTPRVSSFPSCPLLLPAPISRTHQKIPLSFPAPLPL